MQSIYVLSADWMRPVRSGVVTLCTAIMTRDKNAAPELKNKIVSQTASLEANRPTGVSVQGNRIR